MVRWKNESSGEYNRKVFEEILYVRASFFEEQFRKE
jgi:hypothetical protein